VTLCFEFWRDEEKRNWQVSNFYSSRARHYAITTLLLKRCYESAFAASCERRLVGLSRFELLTPRLSSVCSNQLSYRPQVLLEPPVKEPLSAVLSKLDRTCARPVSTRSIISSALARLTSSDGGSRKEVIQPQVLLQLPCYDFTPITDHTLGACLPCGLTRRLLVQPAFVM
jgi:hypothetical protein